jgi:5-(carboxyamino)imidazole ribonucleotide synthase
MLGLAGIPLGQDFTFLEPSPDPPARAVGEVIGAPYDDEGALDVLAARCDVVTYEFENVPVAAARRVAERVQVLPGPRALEVAQDRLAEKSLFARIGIPTARYAPAGSPEELDAALGRIGAPAVVKTRREGYDGKGQMTVSGPTDSGDSWSALGEVPLVVEERVEFDREVSMLAVRSSAGGTAFYPLVENLHRDGILRVSSAPARGMRPGLQADAERYASALLDHLDYAGVLAIEFFERNGGLLANEIAPRVHNSGHWTIEGAVCSQFENHLRGVLGLPLGSTASAGESVMVNLIGSVPPLPDLLRLRGAHVHLYDKGARPGRKLGHVTLVDADPADVEAALALAGA